MNTTASDIERIVLAAIENANLARAADSQLPCSPTAALYGQGSPLDSLGLVNILFDVEDELRGAGLEVSLSDERAMSQTRSPFRSVAALVQYIAEIVQPMTSQP